MFGIADIPTVASGYVIEAVVIAVARKLLEEFSAAEVAAWSFYTRINTRRSA